MSQPAETVVDNKEATDLSNPDVVTKYKSAAEIANEALQTVKAACKPGAKIVDLCIIGDELINDKLSKIYNSKKGGQKVEKGIGFPTSISLNHVAGHFSPLKGHPAELKAGDVVKIDLGVHIDGYIALVADSFVLLSEEEEKNAEYFVTGKAADLLHATATCMEAALRTLKPGNKNHQVSDVLAKVSTAYGVNIMQGVLSHNLERFILDGNKVILNKGDQETKVDEAEFKQNEVYALDIVLSTGEGKPREVQEKTTVFKRTVDTRYKLKMKASNYVMTQINEKFPFFPFSLRSLEDETKARLGITELAAHGLVQEYPVLEEKEGELIAQIKATVLLTSNGTLRITGETKGLSKYKTEKTIEDADLKALLAQSLVKKKKKNKNKKKDAPAAEE